MCDLDLHYPVEPSEMEWSFSFSRTCFSIYPSMNMKQTELFFSVGFESCWKSKSLPGVQLLKALWENGWAKKMGEKSRKRKWKNACGQTLKQVIPIHQDLVYPLISEFDRFCQHPSINCTDEKCGIIMTLTHLHDTYGWWHLPFSIFLCFTQVYEGHFILLGSICLIRDPYHRYYIKNIYLCLIFLPRLPQLYFKKERCDHQLNLFRPPE